MILMSTQGMKVDNDLPEKIRAARRKLATDGHVVFDPPVTLNATQLGS